MRAMRIGVCAGVLVALSGVAGLGQTGAPAARTGRGGVETGGQQKMLGGMVLNLPAPTNKAVDWPASNVTAGFKEMVGRKLESQRILEGGVFNFNLRRETAAEEGAGTHGKKADLYLIRSGEATLTTDGELINPKPATGGAGAKEGDIDGDGIRNGRSRTVRAGDVVFIPAGVPHQITAVNGEVQFLLFRWDTK
jgi:mannose-6-phosphate isomerase-like protein (cupin superfamily)